MPKVFVEFIPGNNIYVCAHCHTHLSSLGELLSRAFRGQHGTAYLFLSVTNVTQGAPQRKRLTTGMHVICDIFCAVCTSRQPLGWKYIVAENEDQKYKEGKFILEEALIDRECWVDE